MRGLFKGVARGVLAVTVVLALAVPAQARPTDDGWWPTKILKLLKKFAVTTLGDGLADPRP